MSETSGATIKGHPSLPLYWGPLKGGVGGGAVVVLVVGFSSYIDETSTVNADHHNKWFLASNAFDYNGMANTLRDHLEALTNGPGLPLSSVLST